MLSRQTPTIRAHLAFHPEPGSLHTLDWYMHKFPEIPEARISETVHFCGPICSRLHLHSSSRTPFSPGTRGRGATCDNRDSTAWHIYKLLSPTPPRTLMGNACMPSSLRDHPEHSPSMHPWPGRAITVPSWRKGMAGHSLLGIKVFLCPKLSLVTTPMIRAFESQPRLSP